MKSYADLPDKLKRKIIYLDDESCWEWVGTKTHGHGQLTWQSKHYMAHRLVYELLVGEIPEGKQIDHLCRNRACQNPNHLEPVSCKENLLRGIGTAAQNANSQICVNGHPLEGSNLYVRKNGGRQCNTCARARTREWRKRNK